VLAIDLSPRLIQLAAERLPHDIGYGHIDFAVGDLLDPSLGRFDHVVSMDSLIHYDTTDLVRTLADLLERTATSLVFTFAPRTPLLGLMHAVGRLFPRSDRAPMIEPVDETTLRARLAGQHELSRWQVGRTQRVARGFYISQAMELARR
jgi:magnesium-protoporphyrin O-methyltransferase